MAIRSSGSRNSGPKLNRKQRRNLLRRKAERRLQLESLEDRRLLAVGPKLVGLVPNEGEFIEDGDTRNEALTSFTFRFDENSEIDPSTLDALRLVQSGFDGVFGNGNDTVVTPGFLGIGETTREVVMRLTEPLVDDHYRFEIDGSGNFPLRDLDGDRFNDGVSQTIDFELDLGAQIVAVVPQPVTRDGNGDLQQARDQIEIYLNNDDLFVENDNNGDPTARSAENPAFYQLIFTNDTISNTDDVVFNPTDVNYDAANDIVTLTFASDITDLIDPNTNNPVGAGSYRLRVGTTEAIPETPEQISLTIAATSDLNTNGAVEVQFDADPLAAELFGNSPLVVVTKSDHGGVGAPTVDVNEHVISVDLNTNFAGPSTAQDLIDAINNDAAASALMTASIVNGVAGTSVAAPSIDYSPIRLKGLGSSFATATDLGVLGKRGKLLSSAIDSQENPLDFPGAVVEPGHRDIPHDVGGGFEQHVNPDFGADTDLGITTIRYNFKSAYGFSPQGDPLVNVVTENQKQRAREAFELWGERLGVQFLETATDGLTIVTGDPLALNPVDPNVVNHALFNPSPDLGFIVRVDPTYEDGLLIIDNADQWNDQFNGDWFNRAMTGIGFLLGLGRATDLPGGATTMAFASNHQHPGQSAPEPIAPGNHDVVHGQYIYRPDANDIDMFKFEVDLGDQASTEKRAGLLTIETFAERQPNSSLLDTLISVFKEVPRFDSNGNQIGIRRELVARNDDYYSEDSFLELELGTGTYFVGVTASGNSDYNAENEDTGFGGTSEGVYDLRLNFRPQVDGDDVIRDNDRLAENTSGTALDGDADGRPGGVYNFWFRAVEEANNIFVDKSHTPNTTIPVGTLTNPFNEIDRAFVAAQEGDIVRIVGNGGLDNDIDSIDDNFAYEVGFGLPAGQALQDGTTMNVPKGVTVMVDAGAVFKLRSARVGVGSSSLGVDRSGGALQVLGTPDNAVTFSSWLDETTGFDTHPPITSPTPGDWGGLIFRNDLDAAEARFLYEDRGIFLNYVNHADLRYGGGQVVIDSVQQIVNPVQMIESRPTVSFNTISHSADAAMSADPNSFEESNFHAPRFQLLGIFNSDYQRVGPEIHDNLLIDNSTNGLFVSISTPAGNALRELTVPGRFDDTDIVHVIAENLVIEGTPGEPILELTRPAVGLITVTPQAVGQLPAGTYNYKVVFIDVNGFEGRPSEQTLSGTLAAPGSLRLDNLPPVTGNFIGKRVYRSSAGGASPYRLVAQINASETTFVDDGSFTSSELERDPPSVSPTTLTPRVGGQVPAGTYNYHVTFVDAAGIDGPASDATTSVNINGSSVASIQLDNLPLPTGGFVGRRLYRSDIAGGGQYELVAELDAVSTTHIDDSAGLGEIMDITLTGVLRARTDARLAIDPGTVVKLEGARIETSFGAQFIAEGTDGSNVIFTSKLDDRYGAGGTFDTNNDDDAASPAPGDWGGIYLGPLGDASLDNTLLTFGGGITRVEGTFAAFNVIEIHQADARITNSVIENNADGFGGPAPANRFGRNPNEDATIFVRGSQPVLIGNIIRDNAATAITINANSLIGELQADPGKSTGFLELQGNFRDNYGPLVSGNLVENNPINGMVVRGEVLTTESVWDDTSITHVLFDQVIVPDQHTYGGLRLQSSAVGSLIVKIDGAADVYDDTVGAGFTATGRQQDIDDRIGGTIHIIGQNDFPVVITSLFDDTVGAGFRVDGEVQTDTNNDLNVTIPQPGDWRSIRLDQFANDRNVDIVLENESPEITAPGTNATPDTAQFIGELAPYELGGDENLRLGFVIQGTLNQQPDVDVFSFTAVAGTEVWFDADSTSTILDTVIELIDADGVLVARSVNSLTEQSDPSQILVTPAIGTGSVNPVAKTSPEYVARHESGLPKDFFSQNVHDAGFRITLPGVVGTRTTYHLRLRSNSDNLDDLGGGLTEGAYRLQVRMREIDEVPGTTIRNADIRYATNGVELFGLPGHSPLTGEVQEDEASTVTEGNTALRENNNALPTLALFPGVAAHRGRIWPATSVPGNGPQDIGNLLATDRATLSIGGSLLTLDDVDFFEFQVEYPNNGVSNPEFQTVSTVFDLDYADGLSRPNTIVSVFDAFGRLVLIGRDSNISDDRSNDGTDLSRGSFGVLDPFIGNVELPEGTYFAAVTSNARVPNELLVNPLVRLEPVNSVTRIAEDHILSSGGGTAAPPIVPQLLSEQSIIPLNADEVRLFVIQDPTLGGALDEDDDVMNLRAVNPFNGLVVRDVDEFEDDDGPVELEDIATRLDGNTFGFKTIDDVPAELSDANVGIFHGVNTSTWDGVSANQLLAGNDDGIFTFIEDPLTPGRAIAADVGVQFDAVTFGVIDGQERLFGVGHRGDIDFNPRPDGPAFFQNILYQFDSVTGVATSAPQSDRVGDDRIQGAGTTTVERGFLDTNLNNGPGGRITGISVVDNVMYAVSDTGGLFIVQDPLTNNATLDYVADLLPYSVVQPFNGIIDDVDYSVADVRAANALQQEVPPLDLDLSVWTQRFDADIGDTFNNTSIDLKHITVNGSGNHGFIDHFVDNENAGLNRPHGVAVGPGPDFDVFVASHDRDPATGAPRGEILRFDLATGAPKAPFVVDGAGGLEDPHSVVFGPDGNVYVSSTPTNEVLRYHYPSGAFMGAFISGVTDPTGLAFDATGDLYVGSGGSVRRYNGTTGQFIDIFTNAGPGSTGNLNQAEGLAFDSIGNLYVADFGADAVLRFGPSGTFIDEVVPTGNGGVEEPTFLTFDSDGLLYVSSFATNEVLRYNAAHGVFIDAYVTAEDGGVIGPRGIAFDPNGNLLVASDHEDRQDSEGDTDWCQDHLGDCGVDKVLLFHDDTQLPAWRWQQDLALGAFITQGDLAGTAVAIDADTIAYGVPGESRDEGVVFIYIRDDQGTADPRDDAWIQQARIKASDGLIDDEFGASLDIDGDTLSVGAPGVTGLAPSEITDLTSTVLFRGDASNPSLLDIDDYYNGLRVWMTSGFAAVEDDRVAGFLDPLNFLAADINGTLSSVDGFYNGQTITIGDQATTIVGYAAATKQFTLQTAFTNGANAGDKIRIGAVRTVLDYGGATRDLTINAEFPAIHLDSVATAIDATHFNLIDVLGNLSAADDFYNGLTITKNNSETRIITDYDGTTGIFEVDSAFGLPIAPGDAIRIGSVRTTDTFEIAIPEAGAVYVFERTGTTWSETQQLRQEIQKIDDRLGHEVALDNSNLLAGVPNLAGVGFGTVVDTNADADRFNGNNLLPPVNNEFTGMVLQFTDGPLVGSGRLITGYIGSTRSFLFATPFDGAPDNGDAFRIVPAESGTTVVFRDSVSGFAQEATITPTSGGTPLDLFGTSVDVEGDRAVVGAPNAIGGPGSAYVFNRDAGGNWIQSDRVQAGDPLVNDLFGTNVALDATTVVVAALGDDVGGVDAGSVYVFDNPAGSFVQRAKLRSSDANANNRFGTGLDVRNGRVVVGAPGGDEGVPASGSVYTFHRDDMGNADPTDDVWTEFTEVTGTFPQINDEYGTAVAIDGDNFVVGDPSHARRGADSGTAEVFVFGDQKVGTFVSSFVPIGTGGLHEPRDIAFSGNEMYVSSLVSDSIIRYDATTGDFLDLFIRPGDGGLDGPHGLGFGPDGKLYVSSSNSNEVLRYNADGSFDRAVVKDVVNRPTDLLIDGTDIYVSSTENDAIMKFALDLNTGDVTLVSQLVPPAAQGLDEPVGLALRNGLLYVASADTNQVMRFQAGSGAFVDHFIGAPGSTQPALSTPMGLEFDGDGNLYVTNDGNDTILRFDGLTGEFIDEYVGQANEGMVGPVGITLHNDILHVAIADNDEVMRFDPVGTPTFDFFEFEVTAPETKVIIDLDMGETGGPGSFNSLMLLDTNDFNDDASPFLGQGGTLFRADSYLELELNEGVYVVAIGEFDDNDPLATDLVNPADLADTYTLHVSIEPGFTEDDIERGNVVARSFQGVTTRQRATSGDAFEGLLFMIDSWGELYAYDTTGTPAPFFAGNNVSVNTGIEDARGLAFNATLWHITDQRHADQGHGLPTAFDDSNGLKSAVVEVEPNDTFATAMDLEREFWHQGYDSNIGDEQVPPVNTSRKFPHVSVNGSGDGTHDYYSFQVDTPGSLIHVDIDSNIDHLLHPNGIPDMELLLLNENGGIMEGPTPIFPTCPACADDDTLLLGDLGSVAETDPYLENPAQPVGYLINTPGRYIIQVTKAFPALATYLQPLDEGDYYTLNISVQNHRVDGPKTDGGTSFFFGTNIIGQIDDASNEEPVVITSPDHGLADGDRVYVQDVEGNVEANGTWVISVVDVDTFELDESDGRLPPNQGRSSLYTGGGTWRHLRMPEDVQGQLLTNPFSLKGYAAADKPVFYFNYYMELEDDPNIDVFNVILIEENGVEHTIASKNNGMVNTPPTSPVLPVWRQARIELDEFVGLENMRLRFEFDTVDAIASQAEGVFIDDLIIGFAERGEMVADARNDGTFAINTEAPVDEVLIGDYQLEIRVGTDFATSGRIIPDTNLMNSLTLHSTFDTNDRQARQLTLEVPDGSNFTDGEIFTLGDGIDPVTFEFDSGGGVGVGNIRVPFLPTDPDFIVARSIRDAINSQSVQTVLDVTAGMSDGTNVGTAGNDNRLNLYGNAVFNGNIPVTAHDGLGDTNLLREQGQVLVHSNYITDSLDWGILSQGGRRDAEPLVPVNFLQSHNAPVRNLLLPNNTPVGGLAPGVLIENNVISGEGLGGIHFAGEVRPIEIVPLIGLPTPGDQVCDGWTFTISSARQTVTFEFEDISGNAIPLCGSNVQAGNGWQEGNVPVFYRMSSGYIGRGIGYSQLEMAHAIRDAINSSTLVANDTGEGVKATIYHSRMRGDAILGPEFAVYVEGAVSLTQNPARVFHSRRVGIGDSPQPFGRLINNTIYGNDGAESTFAGTALDEPNDLITEAIHSRQGRQQSPETYRDTAYIGDNLDAQGDPSLDVDFYRVELDTHERVIIDVDAAEALPATALVTFENYDPLLFNQINNNFSLTANQVGEFFNDIDIIVEDSGTPGPFADVDFDIAARTLTIGVDPLVTTANQVILAINFEGTFTATLDRSIDITNDGTGVVDALGPVGRTADGTLGTGLNSLLRLFNSVGEELAISHDDSAPGENFSLDPYLDFTAAEAGTYFIGVSGADNSVYSALSLGDRRGPASRGEYSIEIDVKAPRDWYITPADGVRQFNGTTITIDDVNNSETYQLIDRINVIPLLDPSFIPIIYDSTPIPAGQRGPGYRPPEMTVAIAQTIAANTQLDIDVSPFGGFRTTTPGGPANPLGTPDFPTSIDFLPQGFSHDTPFTDVVSKLELNVFIEGASHVSIDYPPGAQLLPFLPDPLALTSDQNNRDQLMPETGILVSKEASPTMLNNVLINLESGIVHNGSPTSVVGGSLYQHNLSIDTNVNPITDDFSISLNGFDPLFVNPAGGVFFPAPGSRAIDSAIDSLEDRAGFASVKAAAGIPVSPILAPDRDAVGQLRVDDPDVAPPLGQGANVFKDRGAVDRADFQGPSAKLIVPLDNDADGRDLDPKQTVVQLGQGEILNQISVQLVDSAETADAAGIGVDDDSVRSEKVSVTMDGVLLEEGVDYTYRYDSVTNIINLTHVSGVWPDDKTYVVRLNNVDRFVIDSPNGSEVADGDSFFIRDANGRTVTFEFDSGYSLLIPQLLQLQIPENGILDMSDGERIVVIPPTGLPLTFEYDVNTPPNFLAGHLPIDISNATTAEEIAIATVNSLDSAGLGFRPMHLGGDLLHLGAPRGSSVRLDLTNVTQSGIAGVVADQDRITIDDNGVVTTFEFEDTDIGNGVLFGSIPILFDQSFTQDDIANAIVAAVQAENINLNTVYFGNGHIYLGGSAGQTVDTRFAPLLTNSGQPGVVGATRIELPESPKLHIPAEAAGPNGVADGQTFTINNGFIQQRFEFEDTTIGNGLNHPLNIAVSITPTATVSQIADEILIALSGSGLGLNAVHLGDGVIDLGATAAHEVSTAGSRLTLSGRFGGVGDGETFAINDGVQEVIFEFDNDQVTTPGNNIVLFNATSTEDDIAQAMIAQISLAGLGLQPTYEGGGVIALNDFYNHTTDVATSSLSITGVPQGATPIPFEPDPTFTEALFAERILTTIANSALVGVTTASRGGTTYFIEGAESVSGDLANFYVGAIQDLSGNNMVANQASNQTHFTIVTPNVELDFGDAPDTFPTLISDDGARHALDSTGLAFGSVVDSEDNGLPTPQADGDDVDNLSDEDGVVFGTAFNPFLVTPISITVTRLGLLDGWIDYNRDGDWDDPGEQIFANTPVVSGINSFGVTAPANSIDGTTHARFRLSSVGNLLPNGLAPDGEVEDYAVEIVPGVPPVAVDDGVFGTDEDTELTVAAPGVLGNDTDADNDPLSVFAFDSVSALGADVTVDPDGVFRYDPRNSSQIQSLALGATASDTFTYRARDAVLPSNSATVTISVGGINDAPNANPISVSATEDGGTVTANFEGDDVDTDDTRSSLSYTILSQPAEGSVSNNNNGTFSFDPGSAFQDLAVGQTRDVTFTYRATDSHNADSSDGLVTITVTGTNDAPVANNVTLATPVEDGPVVTGAFDADDADSDDTPASLTYSVASVPTEGSVTNNGNGTFDFDPGTDFQTLGENATRNVFFNYLARDQHGTDSALATVAVTVTGVNDNPAPTPDNYSVNQDQLLSRPAASGVLVNDSDIDIGDSILVSDLNSTGSLSGTSVRGAAVTINDNGSFVYDPRGSVELQALGRTDSVIDTFTYTVSDDKGGQATTTVSITVQGVNNAPDAVDDAYTTTEDDTLNVAVANGLLDNDTDSENDTLSVDEVQGSATLSNQLTDLGATVSVNADGSFSYDPSTSAQLQGLNVGDSLVDTFTYAADDGNGGRDTATVRVTVTGANDAPVAADDLATGPRNAGLVIPVLTNDSDIDGTIASVTIRTQSNNGSLTLNNDNTITYTPSQDFSGNDGFTYEITDNTGAVSQIATVGITINDAPVAVDDVVQTFVNDTIAIDVLDNDNDPDGTLDPNSVTIVTAPTNGIVSVNADGTINYTPTTNFTGSDQFEYTVQDDDGATSNVADVDLSVIVDPFPFRNNRNPLDVNDDGVVSPIDALLIINFLNFNGSVSLPTNPPFTPPPFLNTTGDDQPGVVSAGDALAVINFLNLNEGEGEAEGEAQQLVFGFAPQLDAPQAPQARQSLEITTPVIEEAPVFDPASNLPTSAVDQLDGLLDDIVEDLVASNEESDNDLALIDLLFGDDQQ